MKKNPNKKEAPRSRERECVPCEIPALCRNNYFTGKLLTERDFLVEQNYMLDKLRLHHAALHGWGIVCGLKVKPHPHCPHLRLVVEPGLAIDTCGREIRILCEDDDTLELPIPEKPKPEDEEKCPPEPKDEDEDDGKGYGKNPPAKQGYQQEQAVVTDDPVAQEPNGGGYGPQEKRYPLYICLRYLECESEFAPAPFDECACGSNGEKPNRVCDGYRLIISRERPPSFDYVEKLRDRCSVDNCEDLFCETLESCPKPPALACIPLAIIEDYATGQKVTQEMIDNWSYRVVLPSTSVLDQVVRCILNKLPTRRLTRIQKYNWDHNRTYTCHEFMEEFVNDSGKARSFEIEFENPLVEAGLNRRTFQAIVVRFSDKNGSGHAEVAPTKVWWSSDHTRIYLALEPHYAQTLHHQRFDVFIRLRCNFLVDLDGDPVDGELRARIDEGNYELEPYTGDGIPGGMFESWIRVKP